MAAEIAGLDITLEAAADLSAKQFYFVKVDSNGKAALAGAGEQAIGILQNKPAAGRAAQVRVLGVSKAYASGTIAAGALIAADSAAKAKAAVTGKTDTSDTGAAADPLLGSYVVGVALGAGVANGYMTVLLTHFGAVPTTAS